jgi:molybdopterin molybdotransferase
MSLGPGQLRESNRLGLLALVANEGWHAVDLGTVSDDKDAMTAVMVDGLRRCDALLTTGGIGMGDDLVKNAIEEVAEPGSYASFQVAVKPGRPFAFGEVGPACVPIFGLPGNPVAAMVGYELYVRPALRCLAGHVSLNRPTLQATAAGPLQRKIDGKSHYVRVAATLDSAGRIRVCSAGGQGSHMLSGLAGANALAVLPKGTGVDVGRNVHIMLLSCEGLAANGDSDLGATLSQ